MRFQLTTLLLTILTLNLVSQVTLEFRFTADGGNQGLSGNMRLCNNSGAPLPAGYSIDLRWNSFQGFGWGPNATRNGTDQCDTWTFEFENWQLPAAGGCNNISAGGNNGAYAAPLTYPAYGIDSNGDTVWIEPMDEEFIPKSYNAVNWEYEFDENCFIPTTSNICLGEARLREWNEMADVRVPENRKGWALASVHVATLFNNMVGADLFSENYVFAQSMIEGRMGCDAGFNPPAGDPDPLNYRGGAAASGCFQILPPGWAQIQQYYPTLTAPLSYGNIIAGDNFITAALSKALYDMTTFTKYEKISCADPIGFFEASADEYAAEELLAYAYHEGPYGSEGAMMDVFVNNRATLINEPNLATYMHTNHADASTPYTERIRNNLIQLENNFGIAGGHSALSSEASTNWPGGGAVPNDYQHYGCYNEPMTWNDIDDYIDEAARLFWTGDVPTIKAEAQIAFNAINGGAPVNFSQIGPVIDAIVLNFPAYSPDEGLGELFFATACGSPTVTMSSCDEICPGEEGELWVHLMGQPPFNYTIQGPSGQLYSRSGVTEATDLLKVDEPGTYKVVHIEDANGEVFLSCHNASTVIENAGDATAEWNRDNFDATADCATGDLILDLTGSGPWEITYLDNDANEVTINIPAGASPYTVLNPNDGDEFVLTNMVAGGCDSELNDTINFCSDCVLPQLDISVSPDVICEGDTSEVVFTFTGNAPFDLHFNVNGTDFYDFTNIQEDTFLFKVPTTADIFVDSLVSGDCTNDTLTNSVSVLSIPLPQLAFQDDIISQCLSQYPYEIEGPDGMDSYTWEGTGNENARFFNATDSGWVKLTVDSLGCTASDSLFMDVIPTPEFVLGNDTSLCEGDLPFDITGPANMDAYLWEGVGNDNNNIFTVTDSGWVKLTVDSAGCTFKDSLLVNLIPLPQLTFQDDIISQCLSQYPYEIEGPDGMDSYTWEGTGNENARFFNATDSGWVKLTVDSLGCTASDSLFMDVIPTPVFTLGNDTTLCDLGYPFDISGPANMDAYLWEGVGNANNNIFTVTDSGWVKLTVDSAGCSYSDSLLVQTAAEIAIDLGNDTTQCEGSVVLAAGNGYDSYLWNNDASETNPTYEATASGDYFVRVTNAQGCIGRDTLTVTINDNPTIDLGDTITICPTSPPYEFDATTAGATYEWQDGSTNPTLTSDVEAWYWVEVTVAGCTTRDSAYLEVSNQLQVNIIGGDQTICPGGEAVFYSNFQNATYDWNNGASAQDTFRISTAGIVTLEVTDLGGCSGTTTAEVIIDNPLTIDLGADIDFCQGDSADLGLTPARENLNYSWNTGSTDSTLRVFTSNVYILDVDSAGCTAQSSITVTVNDLPTLDLGADTFLCTGINQTITLDAGSGFATYEWGVDASGNQPTFEITGAGTYAVRVTDNNGCENTDTINITERTATPISLMNAPKVATICPGGSYTAEVPNALQGIAGTSWEWQDGSTAVDYTVENQNDGDDVGVKLLYTNEFGCVSDDSITVRVRNNLPIAISSVEVCEGEDVTFSTNYTGAEYQHEWNNDPVNNQSDFTINNVQLADAGNITVIVNSNLGCSGDTTVALTVNALPTPELTNDSLCEGESLVLNTGAAGNHLWQDGSNNNNYTINNATVSDAGVYSVIVTSSDNCSKDTSMELWVFATPDVEILDPPSVCEGQEVTLTTNLGMGYDFEWTGNVTTGTLEVNQNGTYEVTATDQQTGCVGTDDIELNFLTVPNVVLPADSVICEGTEWYIAPENSAALADYDIEWSTGESSIGIVVNEFGSYGLRVSNAQCESRDTVNVMVNPLPVVSLSGDTVLCFDDIGEYILNPGRSTSYLWTDGDTSSVKIVSEPGVYGVTLTDLFGCEAYGEKEIKEDCPSAVWIPNAFSPNGDGLNDRLEIMGRGVEEVGMLVFNRWGELIWEGNNVGDLWDGTHNNLPVQQDVYVYKLTYRYKDVEGILRTKERIGSVAVIR